MKTLPSLPDALNRVKKPPTALFYRGDISLLNGKSIAIVGTRKPTTYTKRFVTELATKLGKSGVSVVSGAAMGVDALAHKGAFPNTIAVMANGLDVIYPKINKHLIEQIYTSALALSEYEPTLKATNYSFVVRNRIVVGLSEAVVIAQADEGSGSMRTAQIALDAGVPIYVFPHHIGESEGTNRLLEEGRASLIGNINRFVQRFATADLNEASLDPFLEYCRANPSYEDVVRKYPLELYEYELEGKIRVQNSHIILL